MIMTNTFKIYENLKKTFDDDSAKNLTSVLSQIYEDVANTVTKVEFKELRDIVAELAEAQIRTEKEIKGLAKQVGGLSMAVGYGIEDNYIPIMDDFVLKQYGVEAKTVERKFIEYKDGTYDEINLYIEGETDGKKIYIIGESKAQPGKKDFDRFDTMLKRFKNNFNTDLKAFIIGYQFSPEVEKYAKAEYPNIDFFKTYQIERIAKKAAV